MTTEPRPITWPEFISHVQNETTLPVGREFRVLKMVSSASELQEQVNTDTLFGALYSLFALCNTLRLPFPTVYHGTPGGNLQNRVLKEAAEIAHRYLSGAPPVNPNPMFDLLFRLAEEAETTLLEVARWIRF